MGSIEERIKQKNKKERTQKIILGSLAVAGALPLALIAPGVVISLKKMGFLDSILYPSRIKRSLHGLVKRGLVEFQTKNGKKFLSLTTRGRKALNRLEAVDFKIEKPKRWDGKWRVIIFDIAERRRRSRDLLRQTLIKIGFYKLQQSVWIYPYPCEDLITLLKTDLELGKNLLYLVVEEMENDKVARLHFNLQ